MRRRVSGAASVLLAIMIFSSISVAAPLVKRERTVSPYGDGDYITIGTALSSIPTTGPDAPSATNRYRITVKPGLYNENVGMLQYVDLVGSGQGNTVISSNSGSCTSGTVIMNADSSLENITVQNANTSSCSFAIYVPHRNNVVIDKVTAQTSGQGNSGWGIAGICIQDSSATAPDLSVIIKDTTAIASGSASGSGVDSYGILVFKRNSDVKMVNVNAICNVTSSRACAGVGIWEPVKLDVLNSHLQGIGGQDASGFEAYADASQEIKLTNVICEANLGTNNNAIYSFRANLNIDRSTLTATGTSSSGVFMTQGGGPITINNSKVSGDTNGINKSYSPGTPVRIGSSMLGGSNAGLETGVDKITNCHEQDFTPIPNFF